VPATLGETDLSYPELFPLAVPTLVARTDLLGGQWRDKTSRCQQRRFSLHGCVSAILLQLRLFMRLSASAYQGVEQASPSSLPLLSSVLPFDPDLFGGFLRAQHQMDW